MGRPFHLKLLIFASLRTGRRVAPDGRPVGRFAPDGGRMTGDGVGSNNQIKKSFSQTVMALFAQGFSSLRFGVLRNPRANNDAPLGLLHQIDVLLKIYHEKQKNLP